MHIYAKFAVAVSQATSAANTLDWISIDAGGPDKWIAHISSLNLYKFFNTTFGFQVKTGDVVYFPIRISPLNTMISPITFYYKFTLA